MILNQNDCQVLIIDIQEKLLNAVFNKDIVLKKSKILAQVAKILKLPVTITEQYPKGLGFTIEGLKVEQAEMFEKTDFNALEDNSLLNTLERNQRKQVLVLGIETHICVHQSVQALLNKGFDVTVVKDACGSRCELEYSSALDNMLNNGAKIKTTEMVIFELLKTAKHPNFKEIQSLIK